MSPRLSTSVLVVDPHDPDPAAIDEAARVLRRGGLVAFATETVYGLGAVATDEKAVARIYAAKGRPAINPLIVHVADIEQARSCATDWPDAAEILASRFWPGPLTIVLNRTERIPDIVSAGKATVGLRIPASDVARRLIEQTGEPLAAPSANRSNRLSPTRAEHVLGDLDGLIDMVIDSGPTNVGLESTVLDVTRDPPRLLRPGPITRSDLESALSGGPIIVPAAGDSAERPSSPGQFPVHYSPRTPSFRVDSVDEIVHVMHPRDVALIWIGERPSTSIPVIETFGLETPAMASRSLYDVLHRCDALEVRSIIVIMPPDRPEWLAVRDRLLRATRPYPKGD